jgi:antitoxin component YwqK of YwqJK toxin-antitoxin module
MAMKKVVLAAVVSFGALGANAQDRVEYKAAGEGRVAYTRYHPSGRIFETGTFQDGVRTGIWRRYAEDGRLVARVRFKHGVRNGICVVVNHEDGTRYKVRYASGQLVRGEQFDRHGSSLAVKHGD